ncbi:hypothetical protein BT96DRAFT_346378 [Gymnopus androsaceus JB14]|uniref:NADAR domain-containing protein n=1 Tax=Gymnopus androsaceus JB14 TaxID=1447944 RepID=A0A6A4I3Z5_9AGAR|nr:hypothetical protein BT96DRAFT_346378 [Gymnopus androsaceus JB14]
MELSLLQAPIILLRHYPAFPGYPPAHAQHPNQHLVVPYPYFSQPPPNTKRRRTKKRRASAGAVTRHPGYVSQAPSASGRHAMPAPAISESRPPPDDLFTPTTNTRLANFPSEPQVNPRGRAQTPFHGPVPPLASDEDNNDPPPQVVIPSDTGPEQISALSVSQHQRRHSEPLYRPNLPPPRPLDPTRPSAFDRPLWSPSGNPLPEPPRDLFDSDAYKAVLNIPRGTDLFTALYGYQRNQVQQPGQEVPNANPPQRTRTGLFGRKNSKSGGSGGLFRTLTGSRNRKQPPPQPQETARDRVRAGDVRLVPFPVPVTRVTNEMGPGREEPIQPMQGAFRHVPPSEEHYVPPTMPVAGATGAVETVAPPPPVLNEGPPFPVMTTNGPPLQSYPPRAPSSLSQRQSIFHPEPSPIAPQQPLPPFIFTQDTQLYKGFFPHSEHRVIYQNEPYPTATHLHEALKYLPAHPEIATQIRLCVNLLSVYPLSAQNSAHMRADWGLVFLHEMEKVLLLKFRQHSSLRELLVERVEGGRGREIIYRDERDAFWADGGEGRGANELGKILGRVRDSLINERDAVMAQRAAG